MRAWKQEGSVSLFFLFEMCFLVKSVFSSFCLSADSLDDTSFLVWQVNLAYRQTCKYEIKV